MPRSSSAAASTSTVVRDLLAGGHHRRIRHRLASRHLGGRADLDCAYKLQEYAGLARRKRREGKATWPGRKQVYRRYDGDGRMREDVLTLEDDPQEGEPLIRPVMRSGRRLEPMLPPLADSRARATADLARLPTTLRCLEGAPRYPVHVAPALIELARRVDERTG